MMETRQNGLSLLRALKETLQREKKALMANDSAAFENIVTEKQAFLNLLKEVLKLLKAKNRLNGEDILDNQDVCQILKLSKRSLQRLRSLGLLPYMQIGQKTFYLESDIMDYIQKQKDDKKTLPKKRDDEIREDD